eukprot:4765466-Pyramimonas_sp.AAC.1
MTLKNLFPRGSAKHRGQVRSGWRWTMNTEEEPPDEEDPGEYWVQDDDGYWYEWDDERGIHVCTDEGDDNGWDCSD